MSKKPEIVFTATVGRIVCQIIRANNGYVRQQIFPSGHIFEEDYNEEEYQNFLRRIQSFDGLSTPKKIAE